VHERIKPGREVLVHTGSKNLKERINIMNEEKVRKIIIGRNFKTRTGELVEKYG